MDASDLSRYRIAREIGLDYAVFSRFVADKIGLSVKNLDAIADLVEFAGSFPVSNSGKVSRKELVRYYQPIDKKAANHLRLK